MFKWGFFNSLALVSILTMFASACTQQGPAPTPKPTIIHSLPELKYLLIANFDNVFYVDPDFYPVSREGQEEKNALQQFPIIKSNDTELSAILKHLGLLNQAEYTNEEKLIIYREHKKLTRALEISASGDLYHFIIRVGETKGERIEGTITPYGKIIILKREPSFNTRPICLAVGTLIDTPNGPLPVEHLYKGITVWTLGNSGERISRAVLENVVTAVPSSFQILRIGLSDGRTVSASPGHPSAQGLALGYYRIGDILDSASVIAMEYMPYHGDATYDLLPDSSTGLYWANGILLRSTIAAK
jgi:hypothetical protein